MNSSPRVSIVIVNFNGSSDTIECVGSLMRLTYLNFDILVIDNGSTDDQLKLLKNEISLKVKKIVELKKNLGFAISNNVGIRLALHDHADYVLLLNNDTIVDPHFLTHLVIAAETDKSIGVIGPKMYFYQPRNTIWFAGGKLNMYFVHKTEGLRKIDRGEYNTEHETDYIAGACMLIRSNVFRRIGLLPKEYFLGWEDIDFCLAAKKAGYKIFFLPRSILWHKASASYHRHGSTYLQVFLGFRNRVILRRKYLTRSRFWIFIATQLLIVIPTHILYYFLIYKDIKRVKYMLNGMKRGFRDMNKVNVAYAIEGLQ